MIVYLSYFLDLIYDDFVFMNLQVTSPFRLVSHIQESMDLFESSGLENLVSFVDHPFKKDLYMKVKGNQLCYSEVCDNNLDHTYYPNGSIWISRKNTYLKNKTFLYGQNICIFDVKVL